MKRLLYVLMPLALISCGGGEDENDKKSEVLDLSEFGLEATIEAGNYKEVDSRDFKTNFPLTLCEKSIDIMYDDDMVLYVQQAKENRVERALVMAETFGDKVMESGDNYYLIETEKQGKVVYNCSYFFETEGGVIEVRVTDEKLFFYTNSEEQARKGMEIAKTFKFK